MNNQIDLDIIILKDIPTNQIKTFEDRVVYEVARTTLDLTAGNFPRLTGELERGSYAMGVVGSNKEYGIGSEAKNKQGQYYAKYVWEKPQNTNWTNPNTIAQWYYWKFRVREKQITDQAIRGALNSL